MAKQNKNKATHNAKTGSLLNFSEGSYLASTSSPLYALLFLLPLIIAYEAGIIVHINPQQDRFVATFAWLMAFAQWLGLHRNLAWAFPGFVVVIILVCWHLSSDYPWRIKPAWLGWMALESVLLSLPLFAVAAVTSSHLSTFITKKLSQNYTQNNSIQTTSRITPNNTNHIITTIATITNATTTTDNNTPTLALACTTPAITATTNFTLTQSYNQSYNHKPSVPAQPTSKNYAAIIITSIGAGIYEELIFRLIIFGLLLIIIEDVLYIRTPMATAAAVLLSAVLFSAHHYVGINTAEIFSYEEKFQLGSFIFRTIAGIYFAIIFRYRGYGIAAGAHIAYDIIYFTFR